MKREIEKLNLTKRQYKFIASFLISIAVVIFASVFYTAEISVALSVVFIIVGTEFIVFGFLFNLVADMLQKCDDKDILDNHCLTKKNKRSTLCIASAVVIMLVLLSMSYYFVNKNAFQKAEIVTTDEAETEVETAEVLYVYITEKGERYHYNDTCSKGNYFQVTIDEALEKGLTPCKRCVK